MSDKTGIEWTGAALLLASGAADGHWYVCAGAVGLGVTQAWVGRLKVRARRRITEATARTGAGCG